MLVFVTSLAGSALSRRYLLGPIIALALVGVGTAKAPRNNHVVASPTPTPSAIPTSPNDIVERLLLAAHDGEGVYHVDNLVYAAGVGAELRSLKEIEPEVRWGVTVIVQEPATEGANGQILILRAPLPGGGSLCMSEVSEEPRAGTYYARVTGKKKCPARTPRMEGWSKDQKTGWGG